MKRNFLLLLLLLAISKVYSKQFLSDNDNGTSFFSKESLELLNIVTSEDFFHKVLNKRDGDTFVKRELQSKPGLYQLQTYCHPEWWDACN